MGARAAPTIEVLIRSGLPANHEAVGLHDGSSQRNSSCRCVLWVALSSLASAHHHCEDGRIGFNRVRMGIRLNSLSPVTVSASVRVPLEQVAD